MSHSTIYNRACYCELCRHSDLPLYFVDGLCWYCVPYSTSGSLLAHFIHVPKKVWPIFTGNTCYLYVIFLFRPYRRRWPQLAVEAQEAAWEATPLVLSCSWAAISVGFLYVLMKLMISLGVIFSSERHFNRYVDVSLLYAEKTPHYARKY
jgi:hypothetical protein